MKARGGRSALMFIAGVFISMCFLAYMGGKESAYLGQVVTVPISSVDTSVCIADGYPTKAWHKLGDAGVYNVRCGDGVVVMTGVKR